VEGRGRGDIGHVLRGSVVSEAQPDLRPGARVRRDVVACLSVLQVHGDTDDLASLEREIDGVRDRERGVRDDDAFIAAEGQSLDGRGVDR